MSGPLGKKGKALRNALAPIASAGGLQNGSVLGLLSAKNKDQPQVMSGTRLEHPRNTSHTPRRVSQTGDSTMSLSKDDASCKHWP